MTPWMASRQAPLSMGFSRQEYFLSGCHALLQGIFPIQISNIAGGFFTIWPTGEALLLLSIYFYLLLSIYFFSNLCHFPPSANCGISFKVLFIVPWSIKLGCSRFLIFLQVVIYCHQIPSLNCFVDFPSGPVAQMPYSWQETMGSIPGQGTRSHTPQLKILHAATKIRGSKINE